MGAVEMIIEDDKRKVMNWVSGWAVENDKFVHVIGSVSQACPCLFYETKSLLFLFFIRLSLLILKLN